MTDEIKLEYRVPEDLFFHAAIVSSRTDSEIDGKAAQGGHAKRIAFWTILFLALLALFGDNNIDPRAEFAFLGFVAGAGLILLLNLSYAKRVAARIRQRARDQEQRRGTTTAIFDASGLKYRNGIEQYALTWDGVDRIVEIPNGTGLLCGAGTLPIPNDGLPDNSSPDDFRAQLRQWKGTQ